MAISYPPPHVRQSPSRMNRSPLAIAVAHAHNGPLPRAGARQRPRADLPQPGVEITVVDNGSTDGSGEACDEHACGDGMVAVIHQENRGLNAALNTDIDRTTGDWLLFLDSDDWIERGTVGRSFARPSPLAQTSSAVSISQNRQTPPRVQSGHSNRSMRAITHSSPSHALERSAHPHGASSTSGSSSTPFAIPMGGIRGYGDHLARHRLRLARRSHIRHPLPLSHTERRHLARAPHRQPRRLLDGVLRGTERHALLCASSYYRDSTTTTGSCLSKQAD